MPNAIHAVFRILAVSRIEIDDLDTPILAASFAG